MIYIEEIDGIDSGKYFGIFEKLPADRREAIEKLCFFKDKVQSALAYNLLRKGLKLEYGLDEVPPFSYNKNGKPFFKAFPEIYFNLSHCKKAAACVVDSADIGIDVECIEPFDSALAEYICNSDEFQEILKSDNPALAFTVLWTKKESYLKMMGEGLPERNELKHLLEGVSHDMFSVYINKEYVVSICRSLS
ncbi:MAG: 4'-phosphopantetheinyl transferase superfamily protein [Muribaculaceae bacterium]|nr:4'-phosphopantetheinyl transferase superfamily protein [Muribaculaceae bacterium]